MIGFPKQSASADFSASFSLPASFFFAARRPWHVAIFALMLLIWFGAASPASALSCWRVDAWGGDFSPMADPEPGDMATLSFADCTVVPEGWGWMQVNLGDPDPAPDDLFLLVRNTGPAIWGWLGEAWYFDGLMVYMGESGSGVPLIRYESDLCYDCPAAEVLFPWPPKQSGKSQFLGKRVRLRHAKTNYCLIAVGPDNGLTMSRPCNEVPEQTFVIDHAGNGQVRLRHEISDQCLYTQDFDNATVHHWACSLSPVQRFLVPQTTFFGGGFRLQNVERGQCVYGNDSNDPIRSWSCWESENQTFKIDRLE